MLLVAGIVAVAPFDDHSIALQAGLALFVMNVCCNGPLTNRKVQKNEQKCQQVPDIVVRGLQLQDRPYNDDSTASRLLSEVKHHLATVGDHVGIPGVDLLFFNILFQHFVLTVTSLYVEGLIVLLSIILYTVSAGSSNSHHPSTQAGTLLDVKKRVQ